MAHYQIKRWDTDATETQALTERIRKRGVCEWEQIKRIPATTQIQCTGRKMEWFVIGFKFCPYCGKEISTK